MKIYLVEHCDDDPADDHQADNHQVVAYVKIEHALAAVAAGYADGFTEVDLHEDAWLPDGVTVHTARAAVARRAEFDEPLEIETEWCGAGDWDIELATRDLDKLFTKAWRLLDERQDKVHIAVNSLDRGRAESIAAAEVARLVDHRRRADFAQWNEGRRWDLDFVN